MDEDKIIEERKEKAFKFFKSSYNWIVYVVLAIIVFIAVKIRLLPLAINPGTGKPGLWDIATNDYTLGPDLDPFLFLRWAKTIVAQGFLPFDAMRYVPLGFDVKQEVLLHPYFVAWFHKLFSIFTTTTITYSAIIYPVFMFALTVIAFFFFVRKLFIQDLGLNKSNVLALIASFFLSIIPSLLPRTIAGIPEKEASGFLFLFLTFYLFISAWKSEKLRNKLILSVLAGISTALMAGVWGGYVFIFLPIALAILVAFLLGQISKDKLYIFASWLIVSFMAMNLISTRYSWGVLLTSTTTLIPLSVLGILVVDRIISIPSIKKLFKPLESKLPSPLIALLTTLILGAVVSTTFFGLSYIPDKIGDMTKPLIQPISDRLGVTVAENRQPYFSEWSGDFGPSFLTFITSLLPSSFTLSLATSQFFSMIPLFFWIFMIGSVVLIFSISNKADQKNKWTITVGYALFLFALIFSRYSSSIIQSSDSGLLLARVFYIFLGITLNCLLIYFIYTREGKIRALTPFNISLLLLLLVLFFGNSQEWLLLNGTNSISILLYIIGAFSFILVISRNGLEDNASHYLDVLYWSSFSAILSMLFFLSSDISLFKIIFGLLLSVSTLAFLIISLIGICNNENYRKIDFGLILLFSFFFLSIISARGAVRLIMVLAPPAIILASYLAVNISFSSNNKTNKLVYAMTIIFILVVALIAFNPLKHNSDGSAVVDSFYEQSYQTAQSYIPSSYTQQWQKAMSWVRDNTPTTAVFAHWWDYGYWVQSIGERATIVDGGNQYSYWDYLVGRHVLTTPSSYDAMEFLYSHNTTHLLIDSSDIGKYGAFSSIGSDENYDRLSYLTFFSRNDQQSPPQEMKNSTFYIYYGGAPVDDDIIQEINGSKILLPGSPNGNKASVGAILIEVQNSGALAQPQAIFVYQNKQYKLPLRYAFFNGKFIDFGSGVASGIYVMPLVSVTSQGSAQIDNIGIIMFLSNRTVNSELARLYLYKQDDQYFKLVHSEDDAVVAQLKQNGANVPDIIYYQGFRGPIRIWEIKYPNNVYFNPEYLKLDYPNKELQIAKQ